MFGYASAVNWYTLLMSFNYSQPYIVISAFIVRDNKLLLIQENHHPDKGKWNIPGGKLDFGENPIDAVKREVFEEVGLNFRPTSILGVDSVCRTDIDEPIHALRIIFIGEFEGDISLVNGEPVEGIDEISAYEWLDLKELQSIDDNNLRYKDLKYLAQNYINNVKFPMDLLKHFRQIS